MIIVAICLLILLCFIMMHEEEKNPCYNGIMLVLSITLVIVMITQMCEPCKIAPGKYVSPIVNASS